VGYGIIGAFFITTACESRSWPNVSPDGSDSEYIQSAVIPLQLITETDTSDFQATPIKGATIGWLEDAEFGHARYGFVSFPRTSNATPVINDSTAFDSITLVLRVIGIEGNAPPSQLTITVDALNESVPSDSAFSIFRTWPTHQRLGQVKVNYDPQRTYIHCRLDDAFGRTLLAAYSRRDTADNSWIKRVINGLSIVAEGPMTSSGIPRGWVALIDLSGPSVLRIHYSDSMTLNFPLDHRTSYPQWQYIPGESTIKKVLTGQQKVPLWMSPGATRTHLIIPSLDSLLPMPLSNMLVSQALIELSIDTSAPQYRSIVPPLLAISDTMGNSIPTEGIGSLHQGRFQFSILRYFYDSLTTSRPHHLFITLPDFEQAIPARFRWVNTGNAGPRLFIKYRQKH